MKHLAVVVSDMWDTHWCETLAAGTAALAIHIDAFLDDVRSVGGVVIHAPTQTEPFYESSPQYVAARSLRRPIPKRRAVPAEIALPSFAGCGCDAQQCLRPADTGTEWPSPWTSQQHRIAIAENDYVVCEDGEAAYGVLAATEPTQVVMCAGSTPTNAFLTARTG
jgi:hypothetical protein